MIIYIEQSMFKTYETTEKNYLLDKVLDFYGLLEDEVIIKRFTGDVFNLSIESLSRRKR